jgi:hypothetical protein
MTPVRSGQALFERRIKKGCIFLHFCDNSIY